MSTLKEVLVLGLVSGSLLALIAVGFGLVFGVLRFVDLLYGEIVILSGYLTTELVAEGRSLLAASVIAVVVAGCGAGALRAVLFLPFVDKAHEAQIVFTFALAMAAASAFQLGFGPEPRRASLGSDVVLDVLGVPVLQSRITAAMVGLLLVGVVGVVVKRTRLGWSMTAVADSPAGAQYAGIARTRVVAGIFLLSGVLAATAGSLMAPFTTVSSTGGLPLTIRAFIAVVLAGSGSFAGMLAGALMVGVAEVAALQYLPRQVAPIITALLILPILAFRPGGIFGRVGRLD